jgi:23S rRNA (pseudouridine1915-N3)-methyltransferase
MRILFLRQTKGKSKAVAELVQEYITRCRAYAVVDVHEPKSRGNAEKFDAPAAWIEPSTRRIVLDERGREHTSVELAAKFQKWRDDPAIRTVAFYVGGPYGIPENILSSAHEKWSFSRGTLPSDLAWLILAEQTYRSLSILAKSPYHHE